MGFNKGDQSEARDERGNTAQEGSLGRRRFQKLGWPIYGPQEW